MSDSRQANNPLHGITLKAILEDLVERRGFEDLAAQINIRCFANDPSIRSSLRFLRKTEWARQKVEALYLKDKRDLERRQQRNRDRAARRAHAAECAGEGAGDEGDDEENVVVESPREREPGDTPELS